MQAVDPERRADAGSYYGETTPNEREHLLKALRGLAHIDLESAHLVTGVAAAVIGAGPEVPFYPVHHWTMSVRKPCCLLVWVTEP